MLRTRVIPCLLLKGNGLVKTIRFKKPTYVGDPRNAVKIFNEKEVNELILLDITATLEGRPPRFRIVSEIVSEAFMPVGYGGGIRTIEDIRTTFQLGVEKVIINTFACENKAFIKEAAEVFGSQSIVASIDVKKNMFGKYSVYSHSGTQNRHLDPVAYAVELEKFGAGEIFINSMDKDGTMTGADVYLIKMVTEAVTIPVIACGGHGSIEHFQESVFHGGASAVAAGSMFVFYGKHRAVLINYPPIHILDETFTQ